MTDVVTGRPARWVRNRLLDALVEAGAGTLGWGRQAPLMADVRRAAAEQGRADLLPMLAGEGAALSRTREPRGRHRRPPRARERSRRWPGWRRASDRRAGGQG